VHKNPVISSVPQRLSKSITRAIMTKKNTEKENW